MLEYLRWLFGCYLTLGVPVWVWLLYRMLNKRDYWSAVLLVPLVGLVVALWPVVISKLATDEE